MWIGALGAFANEYTCERLAGDLEIDLSQIYRWAHGDSRPPVQRAIAITEIARSVGTNLTLEEIYATDVLRVRVRMRSSLLPP
jgi:hypothetical protein